MRVSLAALITLIIISSNANSSEHLKVLTFNTWGLKGFLLKAPQRVPYIVEAIKNSGADIVALQEVFNENIEDKILKINEYPYHAFGPGPRFYQIQKSGLIILSKYPIEDSLTYRFKACSIPDCFEPKGTVMARIALPSGKKLNLFNSHLMAGPSEGTRIKQALELLNLISFEASDTLAISMGDYNSHTNSRPIKAFEKNLLGMNAPMTDSYMNYVQKHPELSEKEKQGLTWDGKNNPNTGGNSSAGRKKNRRLDYIFYKPGLSERVEVLHSEVIFNQKSEAGFLSDHYGVMTEFLID